MQKESITVFTKPGCGGCIATKRALDTRNLQYTVRDITEDIDAMARVKELGYLSMPVVETDSAHWTGVDLAKIDAIK